MPLLSVHGLTRSFPGVRALDAVDLELEAGEVHCLLGENGAGKSTLIKIVSGALEPDSGTISFDGRPVRFRSPYEALQTGIATIFQDSNLVPELSVAENILLGREPRRRRLPLLDRAEMRRLAERALAFVGEAIDPELPARELKPAQHQMVEIAKALSRRARVVIMDEPTAALTERETRNLFDLIRRLAGEGVAFIYISHRLEEIFAVGMRITVLRDGRVAGTTDPPSTDRARLIRMMVGRDIPAAQASPAPVERKVILRCENLSSPHVHDCSFELVRGEILGIAGLAGAGRSELARCMFGADPRTGGAVTLDGVPVEPRDPAEAIALGFGFLTEDRNRLGLFPGRPIRENIGITRLEAYTRWSLIDRRKELTETETLARRLGVKYASLEHAVDTLSGGNRQKVLLARWLALRPRVLIFDEPTAGIDVGAKSDIHGLIRGLAQEGVGVIVISSELPELLGLCSRIIVMRDRTVVGSLDRAIATEERILHLSTQP